MKKYRKKPVIVEVEHFTNKNKDRAFNFVRDNRHASFDSDGNPILVIRTLEGDMTVTLGDYIIKGAQGEFYPCKPDIFEKTYEEVLEDGTL